MSFVLEGVADGHLVRFPLDPGRCRVGRDRKNDLLLTDGAVSREHAEFVVLENSVELRDLGSRNGTFVDGKRVLDSVDVHVGQAISFARVSLTLIDGTPFEWTTPSEAAVLSPPGSSRGDLLPRSTADPSEARSPDPRQPWVDVCAEDDIPPRASAAIIQAGRILVSPSTHMDAIRAICDLTHEVTPWQRAVILLCDPRTDRPVVFLVRGDIESRGPQLILTNDDWRALLQECRPSMLRRREDGVRVESGDRHGHPGDLALLVPLLSRGRAIGGLYLELKDDIRVPDLDLPALRAVTDLLSVRLTQARFARALRDQERLEREVSQAARVQRRMLANSGFDAVGYRALARQIPCYEVGGDFYDVHALPGGRVLLALGDVSGKGMGAAMLMSNVVAALRVLLAEVAEPAELARRLDLQLHECTEPSQFVTLFLAILDTTEHRVAYVNAGHCPPCLLARDGSIGVLESGGPPLGLLPGARYEAGEVAIPEGSRLCVFSDGVSEAEFAGHMYGEDRLMDALRALPDLPPVEFLDRLIRDVREFVHERPLEDDMTLMVLQRG